MNIKTLEISQTRFGNACVLALAGRIDSSNAEQFTTHVKELFQAGEKDVVVDFKEVLYLTSAAFRVLLVATDEAERNAARFVLCGLVGQVRELFEMGGLLDAFAVHASREDALAQPG
jgi:anti-anti-sigma factor